MTVEALNKMTSRKNEGAAQNNRNRVRDLINKASYLGKGCYTFKDEGGNVLFVDTIKGKSARLELDEDNSISYTWHGKGASKSNGYVYTPIVITDVHGNLSNCLYGTHSLVCMLARTEEYDAIDEAGKNPICNHMNNRHWDNSIDNLEWTTHGGNTRHGKILASMYRHFGDGKYVTLEYNNSNQEFIVLNKALSVSDIDNYMQSIRNKHEFKCCNNEYINIEVIECFIDWLGW